MRGGGQRQRKRLLHNGGAERLIPKAGQGSTGQGWPARRTGDGNGAAAAAAASSEQCACTSAQNRVALASLHLGSNTCRRRGCWFALVWFAWLLSQSQSQSQSQVAVAVGVGVRIGSGGAGLGRLCLICPIISPVCSVPPAVIPSCTLHSALCALHFATRLPTALLPTPSPRIACLLPPHLVSSIQPPTHGATHLSAHISANTHSHLQAHTHARTHIRTHIRSLSLTHSLLCAYTHAHATHAPKPKYTPCPEGLNRPHPQPAPALAPSPRSCPHPIHMLPMRAR